MSRARLPPEPGQIPAKVIFAGVDEGSEEAENLYNQYRGQIARFHHRARQSAHLSDLPQVKLQGRLDGDIGTAHYIRNNGMETITVQLTNEIVVEARPEPEITIPKPEQETPKWLVIDVIIDPRVYFSASLDIILDSSPEPLTGHTDVWLWDLAIAAGLRIGGATPLWAHSCLSWESIGGGSAELSDTDYGGMRYGDPICCASYTALELLSAGTSSFPAGTIGDPTYRIVDFIPDGSLEGMAVISFLVDSNFVQAMNAPIEMELFLATASVLEEGTLYEDGSGVIVDVDTTVTPLPSVRYHLQVREMSAPPLLGYTINSLAIDQHPEGWVNIAYAPSTWFNLLPVEGSWDFSPLEPADGNSGLGTILLRSDMRVANVSALGGSTWWESVGDPHPILSHQPLIGITVGDMTPEVMTHTDTITWTPPVDRTSGVPAQVSIKQH